MKQNIMDDISKEPCPKGGKHELTLLLNVYTITCKKCGQAWSRHIDDVVTSNHNPNNFSSSKSEDVG